MTDVLTSLARAIAASGLHDQVVHWLRTAPGLPPIVQSIHIVSIACVMASIAMIDLRVLGLAAKSQAPREMIERLMPWMWTALVILFISGAMFVIARPLRYFRNPVFGFKFACLSVALVTSVMLTQRMRRNATGASVKILALLSLLSWTAVVLAGRWIAYTDYLFPPE